MTKRKGLTVFILSLTLAAILQVFVNAAWEPDFSDGAWSLGPVMGFPFPAYYNNAVSSLEITFLAVPFLLNFLCRLVFALCLTFPVMTFLEKRTAFFQGKGPRLLIVISAICFLILEAGYFYLLFGFGGRIHGFSRFFGDELIFQGFRFLPL